MLQHRARSLRFAPQSPASQGRSFSKTTRASDSLLSRLSDRPHLRIRPAEPKSPREPTRARVQLKEPRSPATSFVSARSAQRRDHAAEKWFTDVRKLDIDKIDQLDDIDVLPDKKSSEDDLPRHHQLRPKTDLQALFAPSSPTSLRLQTKRELGGDYTSYLPDGFVDPFRLPADYARLALGRNKHIPLAAQSAALNVIKEATRGKTTRQGRVM